MHTDRCGKTWTGMAMAHCGECHETFSTASNFDRHRNKQRGGCFNPADVGLEQNSRGTWKQPGEKDISDIWKAK